MKIKPSDEQIWASVFACAFVADARQHAINCGHGWDEWIDGDTETAIGTAGDAAVLADWALAAYRKYKKNEK